MTELSIVFVIGVFVIRGLFLGIGGVISRVVALLAGYIISNSFRGDIAIYIQDNYQISLSPLIINILCAIALFVVTMIVVQLSLNGLFSLLDKTLPFLKIKSWPGRILGAIVNGGIGVASVLISLWAYGLIADSSPVDEPLQTIANNFGESVFSIVTENTTADFNYPGKQASTDDSDNKIVTLKEQLARGRAIIVRQLGPEGNFSITQINEVLQDLPEDARNKLSTIEISQKKLDEILDNPKISRSLAEGIRNSPDRLRAILNNQKIIDLLTSESDSKENESVINE